MKKVGREGGTMGGREGEGEIRERGREDMRSEREREGGRESLQGRLPLTQSPGC